LKMMKEEDTVQYLVQMIVNVVLMKCVKILSVFLFLVRMIVSVHHSGVIRQWVFV